MSENYRGIDYGRGLTNVDLSNGIRYGVIPSHEICQAWSDSSESNYGAPSCPKCGNEVDLEFCLDDVRSERLAELEEEDDTAHDLIQAQLAEEFSWYDDSAEYHCADCAHSFDSEDAYGEQPISWYVDDGEYLAEQSGDDCDIFIVKSPYYTRAAFCSPCAPGACYLTSPVDDGERAYCFGHDMFWDSEEGCAPYPVYRVDDNTLVPPPVK